MIYLLSSIALSTGIFVLFQLFKKWQVNTLQAIVINYGVAAALGGALSGGPSLFQSVQGEPWVIVALGIINFGSLYFLLETYDKVNLARSGVMPLNNLGVIVFGAVASVWLLGERLNAKNKIGLALGAAVIVLLLWESMAS